MPVTARLSREFYDRFGDKVTDELVELLNTMDATFRDDVREINELNFQRFEARFEQRLSDLKADLIKWMFLFWLGTVATMAGFGRMLLLG